MLYISYLYTSTGIKPEENSTRLTIYTAALNPLIKTDLSNLQFKSKPDDK